MTMLEPSDRAQALIGTEVTYESTSRSGRTTSIAGVITDVEFAGCSITNPRGEWLGIRFLIKPKGKKARWTHALPDEPPETS